MTTTQLRINWERTFAMDRISLRRARRNEERSRDGIRKIQKEQDRLASLRLRSQSNSGEAHVREEDFGRRAENARLQLRSAKRRGLPRAQWNRWEAEARHWTAEADTQAKEVRQYGNE